MNFEGSGNSGSLSRANEIDLVCDRFEQAWRDGVPLSIEDCLSTSRPESQTVLLEELILVEYELRRAQGDDVSLSDYVRRFPTATNVFQRAAGRGSSVRNGQPLGSGSALAPPEHYFQPGQSVGRFRLDVLLGQGAFGSVWKAFDSRLERFVAVKLPRHQSLSNSRRDQFLEEARAAASLRHRHVVSIYEIVDTDQFSFIVSELVEGESLRHRLRSGAVAVDWALRTMHGVAMGLAHAHEQGLVHRDLKPANILIDRQGLPLITDFGLARRSSSILENLAFGAVIGTPAYMAPEQAAGRNDLVGPHSDIYAVGAILYELLSGRPPHTGDVSALLSAIQHEAPAPLKTLRPDASRELERLCDQCLKKDPEKRPPSASALAEALLQLPECRSTPESIPRPRGTITPTSRRRLLATLLGTGGTALAGLWWFSPRSEAPRVRIMTDPPKCQITLFRVGPGGEPDPNSRLSLSDPTPVEVNLAPGEYLVVAVLNETQFQEVRRYVPASDELVPSNSLVRGWRRISTELTEWRTVKMAPTRSLPLEISIPQTTVQSGGAMWRVPPFQAELHKTSALLITSLELEPARFRPSIDGSSIRTAFEAASDLAERLGGRLPSLAECQALFATGHHAEVDWELNTGVMEWTTTTPEWSGVPPLVHDAARQSGAPRQRIVANGELRASPNRDELAVRPLVDHLTGTSQFEVGLRVVRSTAPRLTPADFIVQGM